MLEFKFPDVGEGIHEGTIVKWRVKEGDEVKTDQVLVEIETDKAIVEIPSPRAGIIAKTFGKEQEQIAVGSNLVAIVDKGEKYDPDAQNRPSDTQAKSSKSSTTQPQKGPGVVGSIDSSNTEIPPPSEIATSRIAPPSATSSRAASHATSPQQTSPHASSSAKKILPSVRMLAQKLGVNLDTIHGTGPSDQITDADILAAANITNVAKTAHQQSQSQESVAPIMPHSTKTFPGEVSHIPYKGLRKVIGDRMITSITRTAQTTHVDTIDITNLWNKRESEKAAAASQNIKLTFLAYITRAVVEALKEVPMINSEFDEQAQEIIEKKFYNIGIAVDTPEGLFVPVIKNADQKSLFELAKEITDLADRARTRTLAPQDMQNGTFTITNYGSVGGDFATAIINYPESAIIGIGKIKDGISLDTSVSPPQVKPTKTLTLALTFDHRIIDGATAARFVNAVAKKLQA